MAKSREIKINLPSVDDLFSTQEERDRDAASRESVMDIDVEEISDFPGHPFKVQVDESLMEMAESIRKYGVLVPALVRPKQVGGYEMVSGHRRKLASELAEKKQMPCIVRELSDDEATIIMVDSNLQREKILPSEKAFAYKMKLEAMKRQAGRPGKNSVPLAQDINGKTSRQILAEQVGESQDQIRRYIRLTELITPILDLVDEGKIGLRPAVEISYVPADLQTVLLDVMASEVCTPSHAQTIRMRSLLKENKLTPEAIYAIMQEEKPNQRERIVLSEKRVGRLIPANVPIARREEYIIKALEYYSKHREKNMER